MSAQFGRWSFDDLPSAPDYLEKVRQVLAPYGPDGGSSYSKGGVDILYYAFHTTKESRGEIQPYILKSGAVITWDGRLDNRAEFTGVLGDSLSQDSADVSVVAAAYERWGTDCFARLIGDWALSIWNPNDRSLTLAKDPIGTRHLYYSLDKDHLTWSTVLNPLVLFAGKTFSLDEEYIAGWLGMFPATHLTPYVGIHSVPPSCFVRVEKERQTLRKYWDFDPNKRIRYCSDADYEEHFRTVFAESVRRRLRSDAPILAELSGGMDSSSIVCIADKLIARGAIEAPRLDTVSYYDDSEPNWNERPYFTKVEEKRGRAGCHIDLASQPLFKFDFENGGFPAAPGADSRANNAAKQFAAYLISQGNRVVLSGIGGDEITGGVPTPIPELADLLARAELATLAHQLKMWALSKRKPWFHLFFDTARGFLPPALAGMPEYMRAAEWLCPDFARTYSAVLRGYPKRLKLFGLLPSFQENVATLGALRRQLACEAPACAPPYEKRYPYLDRDLLQFIYAIPREQLVRPGQRRSLLRRSLVNIVPDQILNRRRKAFVVRSLLSGIQANWSQWLEASHEMMSETLGIVDSARFLRLVHEACNGRTAALVTILRTLRLECWLKKLRRTGVLDGSLTSTRSLRERASLLVQPFLPKEVR